MTIGTASADTFTVNDSTGQDADFTSIKDAVAAAMDNDTLTVYPGTYTENIVVDKELMIISQSLNPDDTIVQAENPSDAVFYVTANNVTIKGFNVTGATDNFGIRLIGVDDCNIAENDISNNNCGIRLDSINDNFSNDNTLSNNIMSDNYYGIRLQQYNDNNTLSNNSAISSTLTGILIYSNNNVLENNIASNNVYGIRISQSSNYNTLNDNTASFNTDTGIVLLNSSDNTLNNNVASSNGDCGICLTGSNNSMLSSNIVLANIYGIRLEQFSKNNTLGNNNASFNSDNGISLLSSSDNTLNDNIANLNSDCGIYLDESNTNMLSNNLASSNDYGIRLEQSSNYNTLNDNTASSNSVTGILIYSSNNMLNSNIVSDNVYGVRLESSSNNNTLNDNIASSNTDSGIVLLNSNDNTLKDNIVSTNSDDGVHLENSSSNLLYNNYFNNTNNVGYYGVNTGNLWNVTKTMEMNIVGGPFLGGNYWVHPNGAGFSVDTADSNKDGICDEQYNISETEFDYLPLSIIVDEFMPVISIVSPMDGSSTPSSSITVSGLVNGTGSTPLVTVNDIAAETTLIDFNGTFTATVPLVSGVNTIYANVTDVVGNTNTTSVTVTSDNLMPAIIIDSPVDSSSTSSSSIIVSGFVDGTGSAPLVTVNDIAAETTLIDFNGTFTATVPLVSGVNTIYANVTDAAGNTNTTSVTVTSDNLMPVIGIISPVDSFSTSSSSIIVSGLVDGTGSAPLVTVNDIAAETTLIDFNGTFTATVPLVTGVNTIYANVTDAAGNTNTTSVTVTSDNLMPTIIIASPVNGSSTSSRYINVSGLVNGTGSLPLVTVNDIAAETTLTDFNGTFTAKVSLVRGANTIYANVTDAAGNTNTASINVRKTGGSSKGVGTAVIIPIQEESEEENTTSTSNATNNSSVAVPEEGFVEYTQESQEELETTPGFSMMFATGIMLAAYVMYRKKD
ncbi:NosD domain-containing protein [Methanococcoides methylutens]|nr:NosD domain-containing protein [Methanococcoides methylutens]